jgi:hypothetical protein
MAILLAREMTFELSDVGMKTFFESQESHAKLSVAKLNHTRSVGG